MCVLRELNKAKCGFQRTPSQLKNCPIATGNWGCGVFGGDSVLKFLLQWVAASDCGREGHKIIFYKIGAKTLEVMGPFIKTA